MLGDSSTCSSMNMDSSGARVDWVTLMSLTHSILLPKDHYLAVLVVNFAHDRVMHNGVKETLAEIRTKFWKAVCGQLIHECIQCRKFDGRPYHAPPAPPLPDFRVNPAPPFSCTGVDFAGPPRSSSWGIPSWQ